MVNSVVHIFYIFTDFLHAVLINVNERSIEVSNYNLDLSVCFFYFYQFLFYVFESFVFGTYCELNCVSQNDILKSSQVLGYLYI